MKKHKLFTFACIVLILVASLPLLNIEPAKASEPTGRLNGLTVVLDTISTSYTVAQIVSFMETYHYNALKLYTGWCNSYWGSAYSGNFDDPMPSAAKTRIGDLIGNVSEQGWYVLCTISDQISPAKTNDTWHDEEMQVGYNGPNSDLNSQDNWLDYAGTNFRRHQKALINTFIDLMEPYCKPRIGLEEIQYVTGGSYAALYAQCMNNSYYAATGNRPPVITSGSSESSWTSTQWAYINYVNATIADFYTKMFSYAYANNNTVKFHVMTDDLLYYEASLPFIYYTQPFNVFANTTMFEATEIECYGKEGSGDWSGLQNVLDMCTAWSPSAEHFYTYGYYSSCSASEQQIAVTFAMNHSYRGVWAYGYNSGGSTFRTSPNDMSDYIPATSYADISYNTTMASTSCLFSSQWTDTNGLAGGIFSWNSTGSWSNDTWVSMGAATSAWSNATKTLPTSGTVVGFKWYVNNTDAYWLATPTYTLTTTGATANVVTLGTPADSYSSYAKTITFTYTPILFEAIQSASLWINYTGTWQNVANNASAVANSSSNSISYTFTISGTYLWNIKVFNTSYGVSAASNRTITMRIEPYFGTIAHSTTTPSGTCNFSAYVYDGNALSKAILSTNVSGAMSNETAYTLTGTSSFASWTKTLPATYGTYVLYRVYANDSDNNWGTSTDYTFQVTGTIVNITVINPVYGTYQVSTINVTISTNVTGSTLSSCVYNVLNGTSWVYVSNLTYPTYTVMTGFVTGSNYTFYAWAIAVDGTSANVSVFFQVSIPTGGHAGVRVISGSNIVVEGITFLDCAIGIYVDGSGDNYEFTNNNLTDCVYPFYWSGTVNAIVRDNPGYNPVGYISASVSVTGIYLVDHGSASIESGATYICTQSPKVVYVSGSVTAIYVGGMPVFSGEAIAVTIPLCVGDSFRVDFDILPDISVIVQ